VALGGKSLANLTYRELAHLVAYVPQEETPTFAFPVETFVAMGRMPVSGGFFDTEDDKAAADEAMRITDCLALRDRSIQELSGGERQRVWIARALAQGASILLLDEPSSHLDVSHQLTLIELAKSLSGKGLAVLSAVHDLNLASSMADRAILLADGTIGMDSKMEEVLQSPLLEKVYGVQFARFTAAGAIRVLPERKL
jgi:iron complex transport system ATP-binding protein